MRLSFDRSLDAPYGAAVRLSPLVERVLAPNPGPFTFRGTGVYLVGTGDHVAVIDPGPALPEHIAALKRAIGTRRLSHILITHNHADHSPAAAPLKAWSGATIHGARPTTAMPHDQPINTQQETLDHAFAPDVILHDRAVVRGDGFTLEAVATPGHTANHLCFALHEEHALFSGDHVMGWSTSVVAPPDGDMADYLASLDKLKRRGETIFYPTHGSPITNPKAWIDGLIAHRQAREAQILAALADGPVTAAVLAERLYPNIDPALGRAALAQIQAHLDHLLMLGRAARDGVNFYRPSP